MEIIFTILPTFLTDKFDGELKLDPVTGAICERELEYF